MRLRSIRLLALVMAVGAALRMLLLRWVRSSDLPMGTADQWAPVARPVAGPAGAVGPALVAVTPGAAGKAPDAAKAPAKTVPAMKVPDTANAPPKKAAPAKKAPHAAKAPPRAPGSDEETP